MLPCDFATMTIIPTCFKSRYSKCNNHVPRQKIFPSASTCRPSSWANCSPIKWAGWQCQCISINHKCQLEAWAQRTVSCKCGQSLAIQKIYLNNAEQSETLSAVLAKIAKHLCNYACKIGFWSQFSKGNHTLSLDIQFNWLRSSKSSLLQQIFLPKAEWFACNLPCSQTSFSPMMNFSLKTCHSTSVLYCNEMQVSERCWDQESQGRLIDTDLLQEGQANIRPVQQFRHCFQGPNLLLHLLLSPPSDPDLFRPYVPFSLPPLTLCSIFCCILLAW